MDTNPPTWTTQHNTIQHNYSIEILIIMEASDLYVGEMEIRFHETLVQYVLKKISEIFITYDDMFHHSNRSIPTYLDSSNIHSFI